MKPKHLLALIIFLLVTLSLGIFIIHEKLLSPDDEMDAFLTQHQFQGSVLIAKEGKILLSKGYGFANEEYQIPNTPQTIFRIGSITKQFTAVAILMLQEQGKLSVQDSIQKYFPDYPHGDKITIHHLLSHTSGIPSITDFATLPEIQRHPSTPCQVMAYFKDLPLTFEPGTDCNYSDSGYIILGAIIEAVTQQPYENFIQEHLLQPLGMHSTYLDRHRAIIPNRAAGYVKNEQGEKLHAHYLDMSFPHAAGALVSSVEDLYQLDQAFKECRLLSKQSQAALLTIQGSSREHQITYGYGFFLGPQNSELEEAHHTIIGHYGTIEGFRAASFRYPDEDLTIIVLSNVENTPIHAIHLGLAHILRSSWRLHATF